MPRKTFPLIISALLVLYFDMTVGRVLASTHQLQLKTFAPTGAPYTLSVPESLSADAPVPLIVALHFGGYAPPHYGRIITQQLVAPALSDLGAVVVAPDCAQGEWQNQSCEDTVLGLIDHLKQTWPIDNDRVVLPGYSMGGIGTWALSSRHPGLFSAAIVMAATPPEHMGDIEWTLPLYVNHARDDELMPLADTESVVEDIRASGGEVTFKILDGVSHFQTDRFVEPLRAATPWLRTVWGRQR